MTLGEKIQFHRKNKSLSQDELGEKLLVSRQTISLWEKDKTLPTIDNLKRLKEILDISFDELLSDTPASEINIDTPTEVYQFTYSEFESKEIFKTFRLHLFKKDIVLVILLILIVLSVFIKDSSAFDLGMALGIDLMGAAILISHHITYKNLWKASTVSFLKSTYIYEVYDNYLSLKVLKNNEAYKYLKVALSDIKKVCSSDKYLFLNIGGQIYPLKKECLIKESVFLTQKNIPQKTEEKIPNMKLQTLSAVLIICSVLSLWGGLAVAVLISGGEANLFFENVWAFYLFLPFHVASIILGFYLKKKGYKYKANIIIGIIMAALCCAYGSIPFISKNPYSYSDQPILQVEHTLGIDIPPHSHIATLDWTNSKQDASKCRLYSTSDINFDESSVSEFEEIIKDDSKWCSYATKQFLSITSEVHDIRNYDYFIIYNTQTKEFNKLPAESGSYVFINILYNSDKNTMKILEYEIEYTK